MEDLKQNSGDAVPQTSNAAPATNVGNTASVGQEPSSAAATTVQKPVDQPAPQVNYEAKYKELQRAYTQETQKRANFERQWAQITAKLEEQAKHLAELRKQPYDREKFLAEFQDKGPEVLRPIWAEDINAVKTEYSKQLDSYRQQMEGMAWKLTLSEFRSDAENYPDFKKLEPVIAQMLEDPNCPVDFSKPKEHVVAALYQLARQTSSAEAIKMAEAEGQKKAEARIVKESKATVTGGGKAASISQPDLSKMDVKALRDYYVQLNGVVDRD